MKAVPSLLLALALMWFAAGCGDTPTEPTPTPAPTPAPVVVAPPVVVVAPAPEPFCPYNKVESLRLTESGNRIYQVTFDVHRDVTRTQYLKRYQLELQRNGSYAFTIEAQVDKLSGPHNRTATVEFAYPGLDPGSLAVRVRVHFPNECHDDGHGNLRLNGEWTDYVGSVN